jgi:hypothetical protein
MGYCVTGNAEDSRRRSREGRMSRLILLVMYPVAYWIVVFGRRRLAEWLGLTVNSGIESQIDLAVAVACLLLMREAIWKSGLISRKPAKLVGSGSSCGVADSWMDMQAWSERALERWMGRGKPLIRSRQPAWQDPRGDPDGGSSPSGGITVLSGDPLTAWSSLPLTERNQTRYELPIMPDSPVVVGRSDGGSPPYLEPAYRPTRIVPGTGQAVLHSGGRGTDHYVSRAHFMLRAVPSGLLFVNGVPRRGGGIRPPIYGTRLLAPHGRELRPGEEYLIESGTAMVVRLPNGTELRIDAE